MAKFKVEQKVEVWAYTTVEAETMEEAIGLAVAEDDWDIPFAIDGNWSEEFWVCNEYTNEIWSDNGQGEMVKAKI